MRFSSFHETGKGDGHLKMTGGIKRQTRATEIAEVGSGEFHHRPRYRVTESKHEELTRLQKLCARVFSGVNPDFVPMLCFCCTEDANATRDHAP